MTMRSSRRFRHSAPDDPANDCRLFNLGIASTITGRSGTKTTQGAILSCTYLKNNFGWSASLCARMIWDVPPQS